jgi:glycosyltransferase involved in cell wall biosynthesis
MAAPAMPQNWLTVEDVSNLFHLTGFEVIHRRDEILWPVSTPLIDVLCNRFFVKVWPFRMFALTHLMVVRYKGIESKERQDTGVSVIIPARNEAGNIRRIIERTPEMGNFTELIFVEGHSTDNTYVTIEKEIALHPHRRCILLRQTGMGKGDAVRLGFQEAKGETLMILDADMTVAPEDLPKFYEALRSGVGEFVNGVRLVYPMEGEAMRFLNLAGNKFFSLAFSWILGQPVKDTLCGTKVISKRNYLKIAENRASFGEFDPFGDFDLLFGAAKLNLKIVELPIRYGKRLYGTTNIQRWKHGWLLLRMVFFAVRKFKFL